MATGLEKLAQLASGIGAPRPIREFPKPPKALVEFGPPEFRKAFWEWWKQIDEWRKNLSSSGGSG